MPFSRPREFVCRFSGLGSVYAGFRAQGLSMPFFRLREFLCRFPGPGSFYAIFQAQGVSMPVSLYAIFQA